PVRRPRGLLGERRLGCRRHWLVLSAAAPTRVGKVQSRASRRLRITARVAMGEPRTSASAPYLTWGYKTTTHARHGPSATLRPRWRPQQCSRRLLGTWL